MQPGDVKATHADVKDLVKLIDFTPKRQQNMEFINLLNGTKFIIMYK